MKFILASMLLPVATTAFVPTVKAPAAQLSSLSAELNGWVPDSSQFAYGLPGTLDPVPEFDPFNFAEKASLDDMKRYREAETTHGRVAMLAVLGFLITEAPLEFHPFFNTASKDIGPAIRHLDEVRAAVPFFFEILVLVIGIAEFNRAVTGWETPGDNEQVLRDSYFPGDVGFDPLGLKPETWEEFSEMSTKELQHGRVAMLAAAGFIAQELTNGQEIFVNLGLAPNDFDPSSLPVQF